MPILSIAQNQRILDCMNIDRIYTLDIGPIVATGGSEFASEIENSGFYFVKEVSRA